LFKLSGVYTWGCIEGIHGWAERLDFGAAMEFQAFDTRETFLFFFDMKGS